MKLLNKWLLPALEAQNVENHVKGIERWTYSRIDSVSRITFEK